MNSKPTNIYNTIAIILCLGLTICLPTYGVDQPQSTIQSETGIFYVLYQGDDALSLSTSEVPTPNCPDDTPDGDPDYFWDFGTLDGEDNGDGTATIDTDQADTYNVTVYCEQDFVDSDGNDYTEDTQTSN